MSEEFGGVKIFHRRQAQPWPPKSHGDVFPATIFHIYNETDRIFLSIPTPQSPMHCGCGGDGGSTAFPRVRIQEHSGKRNISRQSDRDTHSIVKQSYVRCKSSPATTALATELQSPERRGWLPGIDSAASPPCVCNRESVWCVCSKRRFPRGALSTVSCSSVRFRG